jgi:NAD/NADP transhydrogenase beta subunit
MNVLLAQADVPYDRRYDTEEIDGEFAHADMALLLGANDVVKPAARPVVADLRDATPRRKGASMRSR